MSRGESANISGFLRKSAVWVRSVTLGRAGTGPKAINHLSDSKETKSREDFLFPAKRLESDQSATF